jgi:hypothetical protein
MPAKRKDQSNYRGEIDRRMGEVKIDKNLQEELRANAEAALVSPPQPHEDRQFSFDQNKDETSIVGAQKEPAGGSSLPLRPVYAPVHGNLSAQMHDHSAAARRIELENAASICIAVRRGKAPSSEPVPVQSQIIFSNQVVPQTISVTANPASGVGGGIGGNSFPGANSSALPPSVHHATASTVAPKAVPSFAASHPAAATSAAQLTGLHPAATSSAPLVGTHPAAATSTALPAGTHPAAAPFAALPAGTHPAAAPSAALPAGTHHASAPSAALPAGTHPAAEPSAALPAGTHPAAAPSAALPAGTPAFAAVSASGGTGPEPAAAQGADDGFGCRHCGNKGPYDAVIGRGPLHAPGCPRYAPEADPPTPPPPPSRPTGCACGLFRRRAQPAAAR